MAVTSQFLEVKSVQKMGCTSALSNLAVVLAKMYNFQEALKIINEALSLDPENQDARSNLSATTRDMNESQATHKENSKIKICYFCIGFLPL